MSNRPFWNVVSHSGDSIIIYPILIFAFVFADSDYRRQILLLLLGVIFTGILVWIVKQIVRRKRPESKYTSLITRYDPFSFPSGHAARTSFLVVIVSGFSNSMVALILLIVWSILVSYARIKLLLHYFSDIIIGYIIGFSVGLIITVLFINNIL